MKKNRKGFTLVELIVSIAIVAALGIAATLGMQRVMKNNTISGYKSDLKEVFNSAKTYLAIKEIRDYTSRKYITLGKIVEAGYLSDEIYTKINGLTCKKFASNTKVYYQTEDAMRKIYMVDKDDNYCDIEDLEECEIKEVC